MMESAKMATVVLLMLLVTDSALAGWQDDIQPKRSIVLGKSSINLITIDNQRNFKKKFNQNQ